MGIITKGMGAIMKSKMRKAFVDKPTFPGPNVTNILNRAIKKKIKERGSSTADIENQISSRVLLKCVRT